MKLLRKLKTSKTFWLVLVVSSLVIAVSSLSEASGSRTMLLFLKMLSSDAQLSQDAMMDALRGDFPDNQATIETTPSEILHSMNVILLVNDQVRTGAVSEDTAAGLIQIGQQ